jgi:hypothetical protein
MSRTLLHRLAHPAILAIAVASSACFAAEVEIVRDRESVRLLGPQFIHDDFSAHERTTFTWDAGRRGYVDQGGNTLVRIGHLTGTDYVVQGQSLKPPDPELARGLSADDLARNGRMRLYGLLRLSPPRVHVHFPNCLATIDSREALTASFGVGVEDSVMATGLTGTREAILGLLVAGIRCGDGGHTDIRILAETLEPGGEELAGQAAEPSAVHVVAALGPRCEAGDSRDPRTCYRLGQLLTQGRGAPRDPARAAALFEKVCPSDVRACVDLALLLQQGDGVPRDAARAAQLLNKACAAGEPYACELRAR